jgi:hypothetical protein
MIAAMDCLLAFSKHREDAILNAEVAWSALLLLEVRDSDLSLLTVTVLAGISLL